MPLSDDQIRSLQAEFDRLLRQFQTNVTYPTLTGAELDRMIELMNVNQLGIARINVMDEVQEAKRKRQEYTVLKGVVNTKGAMHLDKNVLLKMEQERQNYRGLDGENPDLASKIKEALDKKA